MHFFQTNFVSPTTYIHKQMVRSVGDLKLPFMVTIPAEQLSPPPIPPPPAPFHEVVIQLLIVNRVKLIPTVRVVQCRNFAESYKKLCMLQRILVPLELYYYYVLFSFMFENVLVSFLASLDRMRSSLFSSQKDETWTHF